MEVASGLTTKKALLKELAKGRTGMAWHRGTITQLSMSTAA